MQYMSNASKITRRFFRQTVACDFVRAVENVGIPNAASRPMIDATITISTSVKPHFPLKYPLFMIISTDVD